MVFTRGSLPCDVLFIGEAPGETENLLAKPFAGPAGLLLDEFIELAAKEAGTNLRLAFTNLVCCMPNDETGGPTGAPKAESIKACNERLVEFIQLARPKGIMLVGKLAKKAIAGQADFSDLDEYGCSWLKDGRFIEFDDIYHPSYVLQSPPDRRGMLEQSSIVHIAELFKRVYENHIA